MASMLHRFFNHSKDNGVQVPRPEGAVTFEIICGQNFPNMDAGALHATTSGAQNDVSDCFCLASLVDAGGKIVATSVKTDVCWNCLDPQFHTFVSFPVVPEADDSIRVEVWDKDTTTFNDAVGTATGTLATLTEARGGSVNLVLAAARKVMPRGPGDMTLTVRWVSTKVMADSGGAATEAAMGGIAGTPGAGAAGSGGGEVVKQTLFVIRHGESKWNEAQEHHDVGAMLRSVDHELDAVGIEQVRITTGGTAGVK